MHTNTSKLVVALALAGSCGCGPNVLVSETTSGTDTMATTSGAGGSTGGVEGAGTTRTTGSEGATHGDDTGAEAETTVGPGGSTGGAETDTAAGASCGGSPVDDAELRAVEQELQLIVERALAYFAMQQREPPFHRCPHPEDYPLGGPAGVTPSLAMDCNCGLEGGCVPLSDPDPANPGSYDINLWRGNQIWRRLEFERAEGVPHQFHYDFIAENFDEEFGACAFIAVAHATYDGAAEYSTYSVSGFVDERGAVVEPMVVEMPFE